jgi:Flp pilus assembly protein TadG
MKTAENRSKKLRNQKGSAVIEFGLGGTMLLLFLFGTADFGRLFYYSIEVANAAAAGAYYGTLKSSNMADTSGISSYAKQEAPDISNLSVSSSEVCQDSSGNSEDCGTAGAYKYVQVTASYTFNTLFSYPLIPPSVSLSNTVMMRGQ